MSKAEASCPAAISFIFKAFLPTESSSFEDYRKFGSSGVGSTVDQNVVVSVVESNRFEIIFNGKKINIPTVITAVKIITKRRLSISIKSVLPPGCGFGISGASTLATIAASNKLLKLKLNRERLAEIAHFAEIAEKTGLGTIATQITGGFLIKKKQGLPPVFKKLNFNGAKIFASVIKPLKTPGILNDKNRISQINLAADRAFIKLKDKDNFTMGKLLDISYTFCSENSLISPETDLLIKKIRNSGGHATMAILGQTVLSDVKPMEIKYPVFELRILNNKFKLINEN